jgi:hypothetical protein
MQMQMKMGVGDMSKTNKVVYKSYDREQDRENEMNIEVQKIYDEAVAESYWFNNKNAYWTGYFIGRVKMAVTDEDIEKYFDKVQIASQKLYEQRLEAV